jgi:hypothetical protein
VLAALLPPEPRLMRRAPMVRVYLRLVPDAAQVDVAPAQGPEPERPLVPPPVVGQARAPRPVPVRQPERAPDSGCCCLRMPLSGRC